METNAILQPLFDIVNKIHCDTFLPLSFSARTYHVQRSVTSDFKVLHWYIGEAGNELHGKHLDGLDVEDLDEDKLDRWIAELTKIYEDEMGLSGIDEDDPDSESLKDIAHHENYVIDSQEDRII